MLDGDTHLSQVFAKVALVDIMLGRLAHKEVDDGKEAAGFLSVQLLILAQLLHLVLIIHLARDLLDCLTQQELELNRAHPVYERDLSKHPLRAIDVSAEVEPHFYN